jgi:DNA-binding transcriptional ArsR family regulator
MKKSSKLCPLTFFKTFCMEKTNIDRVSLKNGAHDTSLDYTELRKAALVLRAVNHKLRQKMLDLLDENKRMTVTEIYVKLRLEQSVASQHLAILRSAGVVQTERDGKFIFYSVNRNRVGQISSIVEELAA